MKAFIIRLKENKLSCDIAKECVEQSKKFAVNLEYFDGILGNSGLDVFKKHNIKKFPKKVKLITPGIIGCAASHYLLWKKCLELNETILILEQDGYQIRAIPDDIEDNFIDVIKLDCGRPYEKFYDDFCKKAHEHKYSNYTWPPDYVMPNKKKKKAPYGYPYFHGAWSYMLKPAGAKKITDAFEKNGWVPADKQFGVDLLDLKTTNETIFRLHPLYNVDNITKLSLTRNL